MASIYDDFQEHSSIPKLAKALYELANTHPYQTEGGAEGDERGEDEVLDVAAASDSCFCQTYHDISMTV